MVATEAEFVRAAVEVGRTADLVNDARSSVSIDQAEIAIVGGTLSDKVGNHYDEILAAAKALSGVLEDLAEQLEDRARQCGAYTDAVNAYLRHHQQWRSRPPDMRGPEPIRPQPTAPWMEAS